MVFHRLRILVAAFALVLVSAGQVNASTRTADYTVSDETPTPVVEAAVTVAAAPEPATLLLLGFGLAALAIAARRPAERKAPVRSRR